MPPAWDQGDHLSKAMNHWQVLQHPQWFSGEWWQQLWKQAPSQRAPFTYLATSLVFMLLGPGFDQGVAVNFLFTAILLGATYGTGRRLFSPAVGLWAAGLSLLSPIIINLQKDYLLDYPLTAMVALMYMGMTYFWFTAKNSTRWLTLVLWGVSLGLMLMTRTSGLLFAIPPVAWMLGVSLGQRQWMRLGQIVLGLGLGLMTLWPWFSTNWLTVISTTVESTAHGVIYRRDPQANTLAGWLFYPQHLPEMLAWPLFGLAALTCLLLLVRTLSRSPNPSSSAKSWRWLLFFIVGIYVLFSLGSNKQLRLIIPCLPLLWIALAQGMASLQMRGLPAVRWGAVGLTVITTLHTLFWVPGSAPVSFKPVSWPNQAVIDEIVQTTPFLDTTLGLAVNTPQINPFNMDFYGAIADFRLSARQLAAKAETAQQDSQRLDWYLTKTGDQGAYDTIEEGQQALREALESAPELTVKKAWTLPDDSELRLHHRQNPPIVVTALNQQEARQVGAQQGGERVSFDEVKTTPRVAPGKTYPITYRLKGTGTALRQGLLLLTWHLEDSQNSAHQENIQSEDIWISDHGIGLGYLHTASETADSEISQTPEYQAFEVIENLSITPPATTPAGTYYLTAEYLNRETGEHYVIDKNVTSTEVTPNAPSPDASSPDTHVFQDLFTYLHTTLAPELKAGNLDPIFSEVGRINQYDPLQDYLVQAEKAMAYRLSASPNNLDWLYTQALSQVLQQNAPAATTTLQTLTEVAPNNPYNWAYLGFLHLYQWQPDKARAPLKEAAKQQPDLPNLKLLQTVQAAMSLNIPKAARLLRSGSI
ncbi:MAG: glycosyltransferase family 39 protein [Cyanobacteria bacterium P01_D01_bin.105]